MAEHENNVDTIAQADLSLIRAEDEFNVRCEPICPQLGKQQTVGVHKRKVKNMIKMCTPPNSPSQMEAETEYGFS